MEKTFMKDDNDATMTLQDYMTAIPSAMRGVELAGEMTALIDPAARMLMKGANAHAEDFHLTHEMRTVEDATKCVHHFLMVRAKELLTLEAQRQRAEKLTPL